MDVVVKGRHTEVSDRFRRHAVEKLSKVERFDAKVIRIDVEVSQEHNPRLSDECERVEITVRSRGPVVRAEACADDRAVALDLALGKLEARLRRAADRRRVHHGGKTPVSVAAASASWAASDEASAVLLLAADDGLSDVDGVQAPVVPDGIPVGAPGELGESPVVIREKVHDATPMTLEQALYEMELVGHDFFLFVDAGSGRPSVVYRRKGWDYGVIGLDVKE